MAKTVEDIKSLKDYLVNTYHNKRLDEQRIDEGFYNDTFDVPFVMDDATIVRTGKAARMIDGPAENIITNNPQVFRDYTKRKDANERVAAEGNRWAQLLLRQNPQPMKEFAKNLLLYGEAWYYIIHNKNYNPDNPIDLPFYLLTPNPTIVFYDPGGGEMNGIPGSVLLSYDRVIQDIKMNYPFWVWRSAESKMITDKVPFLMWWGDYKRYFEADEEALLVNKEGQLSGGTGLQDNIYGFVPFIHSYSGFGRGGADGDPANLAVGRLRWVRDLLREQCAIRSTLNTLIYKYAHKSVDLRYDSSGPAPSGDVGEHYDRGLNAFNIMGMPPGADLTVSEDQLPDTQVFQHLYNIEAAISREDPLGEWGGPIGTSGRQQDKAEEAALRRYDSIVNNTAHATATAFGMALRMIDKGIIPLPNGLKEDDIKSDYSCRLELRVEDPVGQDRLRQLGSRLFMDRQIDLETNLTDYQGKTQAEAKQIMAKILVDDVTRNNPVIAEILGRQLAMEAGVEDLYDAIKQEGQVTEQVQELGIGSQGGPPRVGNIQTPRGREEADMSLTQRGVRRSPQGA